MNTKYYIIALLVFVATFSSCTDLLTETPSSYIASESFFKNPTNANMAIIGIYDAISKLEHYGTCEMYVQTSDDNYYVSGTATDNQKRDISHYMVTPSNSNLGDLWLYKNLGIDRANFAIENISKIKYITSSDSALLSKYIGEAHFLRALLSFDLVRYWGDVPYKTTSSSNIGDAYNPRVDRDTIYNQIVKDLNIAKVRLPWAASASSPERATQGSARGLLMRVLLARAGYKLNMDGAFTKPVDAKRLEYFNAVISEYTAFQQNGYHSLFPSFYQFFKNNSAGILSSQESLFEVAFYTPTSAKEDAGNWGAGIGPLTDQASKYGRANAYFRVLPEWDEWYEATDIRRVTSICKYNVTAISDSSVTGLSKYSYYPGKWRRQWMPYPAKDPNNTDVNFCLLRYADVILMYAEALNEVGRTSEAIDALNIVRARSNATLLSQDFSNYTTLYQPKNKVNNVLTPKLLPFIPDADSQGKFRTALYWERAFELCYEGTRKYDLLRWGVLYEAIQNMKTTYVITSYLAPTNYVKGKHELFPIPQKEMDVNFKLNHVNNPGFN
jgi:hypothetical protein